jgi:hypothetical protein
MRALQSLRPIRQRLHCESRTTPENDCDSVRTTRHDRLEMPSIVVPSSQTPNPTRMATGPPSGGNAQSRARFLIFSRFPPLFLTPEERTRTDSGRHYPKEC